MWSILSDPSHATSFDDLGEAYAPLRQLIQQLAEREYSGRVYAFKSANSFNLTTAPSEQESAGHDGIGIEYIPDRGAFAVGYSDWLSRHRDSRIRIHGNDVHLPSEIEQVIDKNVERLVLSTQRVQVQPSLIESVLIGILFLGMFTFLFLWMLGWFGVPVGRVALVSMAAAGGATGLMMIGQAILKWDRPMWRRAPRRMSTIQMGRVVLLGSGIWFTVGATAFLWGGLFGELPKVVVLPILGTMGIGMAIFLVGLKLDRRRLYAAWAVEDAERRAGLIHH